MNGELTMAGHKVERCCHCMQILEPADLEHRGFHTRQGHPVESNVQLICLRKIIAREREKYKKGKCENVNTMIKAEKQN